MNDVNNGQQFQETIARFRDHLQNTEYQFKDDRIESVMDLLYVAYTENQGRDPNEINQCFIDLETYLENLSLEENDSIFTLLCRICTLHEEKAFKDGLRLGAYFMLELREA